MRVFVLCTWHPFHNTGPCITNVFATRRKNFSQWHRSFQRKLLSHRLKFLRHVAITLVIQGPDLLWGNAVIAVNGGFFLQTVIIVHDIPHIALTLTVFPLQARYRHISRNGIANFTVNITYWLISMLLTIVGLISHFNVYLCRYFNVDEVYDPKTQWY